MRVSKSVDVELEPAGLERLGEGEAIRIPLDERQFLNLYPPQDADSA